MSLKARVKVGSVTSLSEARYCAGMGVELLGFPVGAGGLSPQQYKQIIDWISGPELVLEATVQSSISEITAQYSGHFVQISSKQLHWLEGSNVRFIINIHDEEWSGIQSQLKEHYNIAYVIVRASSLAVATEIGKHFPVLLATNNPADVALLAASPVAGLSLTGTREEKPGLQDYSALAAILEQLEED
jgi:phosphoribosylanthranilate isomerase